jgi:hypothetical protein
MTADAHDGGSGPDGPGGSRPVPPLRAVPAPAPIASELAPRFVCKAHVSAV